MAKNLRKITTYTDDNEVLHEIVKDDRLAEIARSIDNLKV